MGTFERFSWRPQGLDWTRVALWDTVLFPQDSRFPRNNSGKPRITHSISSPTATLEPLPTRCASGGRTGPSFPPGPSEARWVSHASLSQLVSSLCVGSKPPTLPPKAVLTLERGSWLPQSFSDISCVLEGGKSWSMSRGLRAANIRARRISKIGLCKWPWALTKAPKGSQLGLCAAWTAGIKGTCTLRSWGAVLLLSSKAFGDLGSYDGWEAISETTCR